MKNKLLVMGLAAVFAVTGVVSAQNLLTNGDFSLMEGTNSYDAADWVQWGGAYNNRETAAAWPGSVENDDYHIAMGAWYGYGAGAYQDISVADDSSWYKLSADAMIDDWWLASSYIKLEFYDATGTNMVGFVESAHIIPTGNDVGVALANYEIFGQAPAGTEVVRAALGSYGPGGTSRFDNAVLEVVPEPATLGLLGLSGLALWIVRRRG